MPEKKSPAQKKSNGSTKKATGDAGPPSASKGQAARPQSQRNLLLIGGAVVVGIVALFLFTRSKPADSMASFMPANTALYFHLDLNELTSTEMEEITKAFQEASGEEVVEGEPDAFQQEIGDALGLDYEELISPWLGDQLGAGFLDVGSGALSGDLDGKFIVVIESSDTGAANAFLDELAANAEEGGNTVTSSDYQGVRIFELGADFDLPAAAQGKGVVFLADSAATIQASLDLAASDSLTSLPRFADAVGGLGGDQLATVYVNLKETMQEDTSGITPGLSPAYSAMLESSSFALGASVVPAGIQIEYVFSVDEALVPAAALASLKAATEPITTTERYPEGTLLFLGSKTTGFSPETLRESMGEEAYQDYAESIDALSTSIGIDINNLLVALDGEFSLGMFPQQAGIGAFTGGYGFQVLITTSHDTELATFFADLAALLGSGMGMAPEPRTIANMASFVVSMPPGGDVLAIGSGSGVGYLTTDVSVVEDSAGAGYTSFADSEGFQKVKDAVGSNGHPVFYLDVASLVSLVQQAGLSAEGLGGVAPLTAVAAAIEPFQGGSLRGVVIFFIER